MNYINEKYVHRLLGSHYPLGVKHLVKLLDAYLNELYEGGDLMPKQLLSHNLSGRRNRGTSELAKVDVDIRLDLNSSSRKVNLGLLDYRKETQFKRDTSEQRVVLHIVIEHSEKTTWAIHIPLQALMKGFGDTDEGYQCYSHGIALIDEFGNPKDKELFYCGITSRSWLTRMAEHFREINGGSNKLFHRKWREYQGDLSVVLNSELVALNHSYDAAMNWEEWIVDRYLAEACSMNMIPGGFKGLRELHKLGYLSGLKGITVSEREDAIARFAIDHPRLGIPNLLIGKMWLNDDYYAKVIGNRENTFSREEIEMIRTLAQAGHDEKTIAIKIGVTNIQRIRNVLTGKTYQRMY